MLGHDHAERPPRTRALAQPFTVPAPRLLGAWEPKGTRVAK
jgi:hypothetical protein